MNLRRIPAAALIGAAACLAVAPAAAPSGTAAGTTRPHAITLFIDGNKQRLVPIVGGSDNYFDFRQPWMIVEAKWAGEARGSGYFIRISTTEPQKKVYAACFSGTRCLVPGKVPVLIDEEMSWSVEVVKSATHEVVWGSKVCLVGRI